MVLIIVMIVVTMISLAGYSFSELMFTEEKSVVIKGEQLQAMQFVHSADAAVKKYLGKTPLARYQFESTYVNHSPWYGVIVAPDETGDNHGCFSVVKPELSAEELVEQEIHFGVADESARLNLRAVLQWELTNPGQGVQALLQLPNMTETLAQSILDWFDQDSQTRDLGAEQDYYKGLATPYLIRNGIPATLEEMLLIRSMNRQRLFGADWNRNYRIDPEEAVLEETSTNMFSSEEKPYPWFQLLTLYSKELNSDYSGNPRINLNSDDLVTLHRKLATRLGRVEADFVVAYRQFGPISTGEIGEKISTIAIDPTRPATVEIESPLDLIGVQVRVSEDSTSENTMVLDSPFSQDQGLMPTYIHKLLDRTTTFDSPTLVGRINILSASRAVLRAIPNMAPSKVEAILQERKTKDSLLTEQGVSAGWLLTEGIVDKDELKRLLPYITTQGDTYRAQLVGFFASSGPSARIEVVYDATRRPVRRLYWSDLRMLGPGFRRAELRGNQDSNLGPLAIPGS